MNIIKRKATKLTPLNKDQLNTLSLIAKYNKDENYPTANMALDKVCEELGITRTALNSRMQVLRDRRENAQRIVNQLNVYMKASMIIAKRLRYE